MSLLSKIKSGVSNLAHSVQQAEKSVEKAVNKAVDQTVHSAQNLGHKVADGFESVSKTVGQTVSKLNPFKGGGPDKVYDGKFVGAGGQTYPATTPLKDVPGVLPKGGVRNNETLLYINGINTTKDAQFDSLQNIANTTGSKVVGIHNSTEGFVSDLKQCVLDKLNKGSNPAVDSAADTIYQEIKAGRDIHVLAHSQGGLVTSRALSEVSRRLRIEDGMSKAQAEKVLSHVKVETFGAAAGHYPDGPKYVHYINQADPVPTLVGLGISIDKWNPTLHAGKGAQVNHFTEPYLNPINAHSFDNVYLNHRVPFDQARGGDFSQH
jgi:hypothetical protein